MAPVRRCSLSNKLLITLFQGDKATLSVLSYLMPTTTLSMMLNSCFIKQICIIITPSLVHNKCPSHRLTSTDNFYAWRRYSDKCQDYVMTCKRFPQYWHWWKGIHWPFVDFPHKRPGPRLNIKTVLSTYGDFHVKDKTAVRTSYL